jgi:hypothetical protein
MTVSKGFRMISVWKRFFIDDSRCHRYHEYMTLGKKEISAFSPLIYNGGTLFSVPPYEND